MKKIVFGLIATVMLGFVGNAQIVKIVKIGILTTEGKFEITENIDFIKDSWNENLKKQKLDDELVEFSINDAIDKETNEKYYYLLGVNKLGTIKTALSLEFNKSEFTLRAYMGDDYGGEGGSITCTGCTLTCNPTQIGNRWVCSAGCPECTKSVTIHF